MMEIRPATAADVPHLLPMVQKICALHQSWDPAKYGFKPDPQERYRHWLTQRAGDPRSVFLVAEADHGAPGEKPNLVGFLIATIEKEIPIYELHEYGFIHDLWIEEDYRHEGLGRQMTMLAVEKFTALGVPQIRLDTATANDPARALFASCGFRPSVIEMLIELKPD